MSDQSRDGISVTEAAQVLGITEGAVRKRVERGKLTASHTPAGRLVVYLDSDATTTDATRDTTRQSRDDSALVSELRDRIDYLERQVEEEREARRRADTLLARLVDRMPELEASPDAPRSPEAASVPLDRGTPPEAAPGVQGAAQPRSWWRRVFGS